MYLRLPFITWATRKEERMNVNDGGGLFDKIGMIDEMSRKVDALADAKGVFRCGLIWDIAGMLRTLKDGLKKEDETTALKIEELKRIAEEANK